MRILRLAVATTALLGAVTLAHGADEAMTPGDADAGKQVFAKCAVCHNIGPDAKNKVGPALTGVVGRQPGTFAGFAYSPAMKKFGEDHTWTPEEIATFIKAPKDLVPGTRMTFAGLKDQTDVDNVIAYLLTFSPDYQPAAPDASPAADAPAAAPAN